jgi:hypothetical protein
VIALWKRCAGLPFGRGLFSALLGLQVPYSGALGATVLELAPGHARVQLRESTRGAQSPR